MRLIIGGIYQGRERYARNKYGEDITIFRDIYQQIRSNISSDDIYMKAINSDVVIAEESFAGLSEIDKTERENHEEYGRLLEKIANSAVSVERVVCGLAQSLK